MAITELRPSTGRKRVRSMFEHLVWFALLWAAGVGATTLVAFAIRAVLAP